MDESYVEEEGYDYAGYEREGSAEGYDGFEGYDEGGLETGVADTNKGNQKFISWENLKSIFCNLKATNRPLQVHIHLIFFNLIVFF